MWHLLGSDSNFVFGLWFERFQARRGPFIPRFDPSQTRTFRTGIFFRCGERC